MLYKRLTSYILQWLLTILLAIALTVAVPAYIAFSNISNENNIAKWLEESQLEEAINDAAKEEFISLSPVDDNLDAIVADNLIDFQIDNYKIAHTIALWLTNQTEDLTVTVEESDIAKDSANDDNNANNDTDSGDLLNDLSSAISDSVNDALTGYIKKQLDQIQINIPLFPDINIDNLNTARTIFTHLKLILRVSFVSTIALIILLLVVSRKLRRFLFALGMAQVISGTFLVAVPHLSITQIPIVRQIHIFGFSVEDFENTPEITLSFFNAMLSDIATAIQRYAIGLLILGTICILFAILKIKRTEMNVDNNNSNLADVHRGLPDDVHA